MVPERLKGKRKRVLVILGAGSTLHAKAPSTDEVNEFVCTLPNNKPLRAVVDRLKQQRSIPSPNDTVSRNFNFETVLAALEDLDQFGTRKHHPTAFEQYVDDRLSAFTGYVCDFAEMRDQNFAATRAQVVGQIKNFFIDRTACAPPDRLREFFNSLKVAFDLTVVTLNYDDIVDRAGDWYDGFSPPTSNGEGGTFDFAGFRDRSAEDPAILLHLHGSVRFDFPRFSPAPSKDGEIVRYAGPRRGLHAQLNGPAGIPQPTPIVAGYGKDRWMTRAAVPFGYYYTAFVNAVQTCPRVLVAGYGGGDEHINSWLREEHPRLHSERRIVQIDPCCPKQPPAADYLILGGDEGYFPPPSDRIEQMVAFLDSL
ncbi:MAG TPA: hypothetical protein VMA37_10685 [Acetobacteraceae bacterium]|nr:hypothetical protein [Acetobacteraceae bacterium]